MRDRNPLLCVYVNTKRYIFRVFEIIEFRQKTVKLKLLNIWLKKYFNFVINIFLIRIHEMLFKTILKNLQGY